MTYDLYFHLEQKQMNDDNTNKYNNNIVQYLSIYININIYIHISLDKR